MPGGEPLDRLGRFIDYLATCGSDGAAKELGPPDAMFHDAELGGLLLWGEEARDYRDCVRAVYGLVRRPEEQSLRNVQARVQKAILMALDIKKQSPLDYAARKAEAIESVRALVSEKPTEWEFFHGGVGGVKASGLPCTFGRFEFLLANEAVVAGWMATIGPVCESAPAPAEDNQRMRQHMESEISRTFAGQVVARVKVKAVDRAAAEELADRELRLTLDAINFYADVLHARGLGVRAYATGEAARATYATLSFDRGGPKGFSVNYESAGPLEAFDLSRLKAAGVDLGVPRIAAILAADHPTEIEERILSAFQWAGRATTERRPEQAFLLYMVALETLLGGGKGETGAGTYRLRLRCAHALGRSVAQRRNVIKDVKELYDCRSRIVHAGKATVTPADLGRARTYAKEAIVTFMTREPFAAMQQMEELDQWFEERLLESGDISC